ncbi:MAG: hypothetical protein MUO55_00075 [Candidatus Atribacteria bacterium]|nr:hypothetical protein [Candidatus Atribacteria bacterium]
MQENYLYLTILLRFRLTFISSRKLVSWLLVTWLINWGLNIASKIGKNTVDVGGEKIPIDREELSKAMNDPEFTGKTVDVEDEEEGKHVEIKIV